MTNAPFIERPVRTSISNLNLLRRGVPKHLLDVTLGQLDDFNDPDRNKVIQYIKNYVKNIPENFKNNQGIMLYGSNGVGKSFIATIIVKYSYIFRYTSKRCTFMDYINEYTRMWGCKNPQEKEELEELFYRNYKAVEFLCLEEIGKELDTKLAPTVLEDLLRYREERGLVTIICTNLNPKDLKEKYGNSIMSLIKGNCTPIKLVGQDNRQAVFKERIEE